MVIQRWQSVLLLIAAVMMGLFSFCSLGQLSGANTTADIYSYGVYAKGTEGALISTLYVCVVGVLTSLLGLIAVFLFKNTRLQKRICLMAIVLTLAACGSEWLALQGVELPGETMPSYSSIAFTPFITVAALLGAYRCIRSDERKLAAANTLRG